MNLDMTIKAASDATSPPSLLQELTTSEQSEEVLLRLILNPNLPGYALAGIFEFASLRLRQLASKHPNVLEQDLILNAKNPDERLRVNTASHSRTPTTSLSDLARDESAVVRYETLFNPSTAVADRNRLSGDHDLFVRLVAANLRDVQKKEQGG